MTNLFFDCIKNNIPSMISGIVSGVFAPIILTLIIWIISKCSKKVIFSDMERHEDTYKGNSICIYMKNNTKNFINIDRISIILKNKYIRRYPLSECYLDDDKISYGKLSYMLAPSSIVRVTIRYNYSGKSIDIGKAKFRINDNYISLCNKIYLSIWNKIYKILREFPYPLPCFYHNNKLYNLDIRNIREHNKFIYIEDYNCYRPFSMHNNKVEIKDNLGNRIEDINIANNVKYIIQSIKSNEIIALLSDNQFRNIRSDHTYNDKLLLSTIKELLKNKKVYNKDYAVTEIEPNLNVIIKLKNKL